MNNLVIQLQKIPKWFWIMLGISFILVSVGICVSLIYRGHATFRAMEKAEVEIIEDAKESAK